MATEIKTWEIVSGQLKLLETSLVREGKMETVDLEEWIASDSSIVRPDLKIIGRQVKTQSGFLDLLAIDGSGSVIIIELKRDKLARDALAQSIDYASDVATWNPIKIGEICLKYLGEDLEDVLGETFSDADLEHLSINETQKIVLVGFNVESSLERMIEWLSGLYGMGINAVSLKYVRTSTGDEVLMRTAVVSEQTEEARVKTKKPTITMSDEAGAYDEDQLELLLVRYLSQNLVTAQRIRDILLPLCLKQNHVTREELKQEFVARNIASDVAKAGYSLTGFSFQMGLQKNDFLRQVIDYQYPNYSWEKDNYLVRPEYRSLVEKVLASLNSEVTHVEDD